MDHTGVSNSQLVKENAAIANAYGGKNVAEQNSVDLGWSTLMNPDFEALRTCIFTNDVEFTHVRQLLVNAVIATDIFDEDQAHRRIERFQQLFEGYPQGMCSDEYSKRKASIMIEHLMQASDVAHTMQDVSVLLADYYNLIYYQSCQLIVVVVFFFCIIVVSGIPKMERAFVP